MDAKGDDASIHGSDQNGLTGDDGGRCNVNAEVRRPPDRARLHFQRNDFTLDRRDVDTLTGKRGSMGDIGAGQTILVGTVDGRVTVNGSVPI